MSPVLWVVVMTPLADSGTGAPVVLETEENARFDAIRATSLHILCSDGSAAGDASAGEAAGLTAVTVDAYALWSTTAVVFGASAARWTAAVERPEH
jgi:hypothetical protein